MTIDLRVEMIEIRNYVSRVVAKHLEAGKAKPAMIHVGFTFDQAGWIFVYLDTRPNASWDGEWTTHLEPETLLPRQHWYEASELPNLGELVLIGTDGNHVPEWSESHDLQKLANILGQFLTSAVATFENEGIFQPLLGSTKLKYCVEEFSGLYCWPLNPELAKLVESFRRSCNSSPRIV